MTNAKIAEPQQPTSWNGAQKPISADNAKMANETAHSMHHNEIDGVQLKVVKSRPKNDAAVPHPDVSLHTNKGGTNAGGRQGSGVPATRPFLTRGSVAERVLMFEKCPEIKALRNVPKEPAKIPVNMNENPLFTALNSISI